MKKLIVQNVDFKVRTFTKWLIVCMCVYSYARFFSVYENKNVWSHLPEKILEFNRIIGNMQEYLYSRHFKYLTFTLY